MIPLSSNLHENCILDHIVGRIQPAFQRFVTLDFILDFQAYHMGLYGDHILWTMPNWYSSNWWKGASGCTPEELLQVVNGSLYFGPVYKNPVLEQSIAGIDSAEFDQLFLQRANYTELYGSNLNPVYYDAIWAAALALNATTSKMEQLGKYTSKSTNQANTIDC